MNLPEGLQYLNLPDSTQQLYFALEDPVALGALLDHGIRPRPGTIDQDFLLCEFANRICAYYEDDQLPQIEVIKECFRLLVANGFTTNTQRPDNYADLCTGSMSSPLHVACLLGLGDVAETLIQDGANVNFEAYYGTPLDIVSGIHGNVHPSVRDQYREITELLEIHGAQYSQVLGVTEGLQEYDDRLDNVW